MTASPQQILVHLDATRASRQRLAVARALAQRFAAQLGALYAVTPGFPEVPYAPEIGPTLASALVGRDEQRRDDAWCAFEEEMRLPGPLATWAQTDEVPVAHAFAQQAFYADLLVLGQLDPADEAASCVPADFVESALIASGSPAVVLPLGHRDVPTGDRVAVAWKESREAARAVRAALPFLQQAQRVDVLAWGETGPARLGGEELDLDAWLRGHGVQAVFHREGHETGALGERLLARVHELDADLLVMGCYGHSRAREWMLGGVSRTVLRAMHVPVLMAH
jgi:nucleotide-binding universal stress UspA family protein